MEDSMSILLSMLFGVAVGVFQCRRFYVGRIQQLQSQIAFYETKCLTSTTELDMLQHSMNTYDLYTVTKQDFEINVDEYEIYSISSTLDRDTSFKVYCNK